MISILTAFPPTGRQLDAFQPHRPENWTNSRLDVQRRHLENKKMYPLDAMSIDQRSIQTERDLLNRQMIAEARQSHVSVISRIRRSVGQTLISAGERIRPEIVSSEPEFNV